MNCPRCGASNPAEASFCQSCGTALTASATPPAEPASSPGGDWWTSEQPRTRPGRQWSFNPERFAVGDWLGAILAVVVALVAMAALSAATMGIAGYDAGAGTWFKRMLAFVVLSVGGSVHLPEQAGSSFGRSVSISAVPLTFTLTGFGLLGWIIAKRLKRAPHTAVDFVLQAIRTIIVMVVLLVVIGFVARHGHRGQHDYIHVKVAYSAFFGACVTLVTLGVTFFVAFGATLRGRTRVWRDRMVGPAVGVFTVVALAFVLATIYALVQVLAVPHDLSSMTQAGLNTDPSGRRDELSSLLGLAPNNALWMFMWSMGVPLRLAFGHQSQSWTLTTFTDGDSTFGDKGNGAYWVLPAIAAVLWLVGAAAAALHAATPREGRRNAYRMTLLAPLLTSAIFVMAGLAVRAGRLGLRMHFAYWWAFLLGIVWAAGAGILAPEIVLRLPARLLIALRRALVRFFGAAPTVAAPDGPAPVAAPSATAEGADAPAG